MKELHIDIESYSSADLGKCGVYKYAVLSCLPLSVPSVKDLTDILPFVPAQRFLYLLGIFLLIHITPSSA